MFDANVRPDTATVGEAKIRPYPHALSPECFYVTRTDADGHTKYLNRDRDENPEWGDSTASEELGGFFWTEAEAAKALKAIQLREASAAIARAIRQTPANQLSLAAWHFP